LSRRAVAETSLRPTCFDDYVGQRDVIDNLKTAVRAARRGGWQLDHTLLTGPKGLGKTSLATVIAADQVSTRRHVDGRLGRSRYMLR
jgi:Holliday junction DNA helicase RuvB